MRGAIEGISSIISIRPKLDGARRIKMRGGSVMIIHSLLLLLQFCYVNLFFYVSMTRILSLLYYLFLCTLKVQFINSIYSIVTSSAKFSVSSQ